MRPAIFPDLAPRALLASVALFSAAPFLLIELLNSRAYWKLDTAGFLVFHNVAEFFSVMVSLSIFGIGWYTFDQSRDRHALFLSAAFLAIGLMDFMHTLSYAGMPSFITPNDANKPTQFWLAVRFFTAATLLGSAWIYPDSRYRFLGKARLMIAALSIAALVFAGVVCFPERIPAAYLPGVGLTAFKKNSEYLIVALLLAAFVMYWRRMAKTGDRSILYYLSAFIFCIFGELVFAVYRSVFDLLNMLGHCYKIVAFFLIYRGIFVCSVHAPYRKLAQALDYLRAEVAERRQAEAKIRLLKNYLANIIDSMPAVLVGMDADQTVTQWNRQAEAVTGIAAGDALGRPVSRLLPDFSPWIEELRDELSKRRPAFREKLLIEKGGERKYFDLTCYPLISNCVEGAVLQISDVTERSRIQELMVQTEKMMSVGGLAAGMAHEINNPLGIITQAAQNLERRLSPELAANHEAARAAGITIAQLQAYFERRQITAFIASIREASARASRIIANILSFSRNTDRTLKPEALSEILEQSLELAANDYDLKKRFDFRNIELVREYAPDLPRVPLSAVEIEQVALNLLKNAAQAMHGGSPERAPRIVLRLRQEERYAVIEVEDNGPGMTERVRRRVFEPFFTTKEPGIGTGLGLSVSYMIVTQNHKGLMTVESAPGSGARFIVRLPLLRENGHG
jgi:PAS domain S-box-containing protein